MQQHKCTIFIYIYIVSQVAYLNKNQTCEADASAKGQGVKNRGKHLSKGEGMMSLKLVDCFIFHEAVLQMGFQTEGMKD